MVLEAWQDHIAAYMATATKGSGDDNDEEAEEVLDDEDPQSMTDFEDFRAWLDGKTKPVPAPVEPAPQPPPLVSTLAVKDSEKAKLGDNAAKNAPTAMPPPKMLPCKRALNSSEK